MPSDLATDLSPARRPLSALWAHSWLHNRRILALVAAHLAAAAWLGLAIGMPFQPAILALFPPMLTLLVPGTLVVLFLGRFVWMALAVRPDRPIRWFAEDLGRIVLDPARIVSGAVALVAVSVFSLTFVYFKTTIPAIQPFSWDATFAALDRALHFGVDPWRLTMALFGSPLATTVLNGAYHLWMLLMYLVLFVACFDSTNPVARQRYLLGCLLTWMIGGNLMAIGFSSAGPAFYQLLGLGETFAPLVNRLHDFNEISPVWALDLHKMLWDGYTGLRAPAGISAFPSMHLAGTMLATLYCFSRARWAGWAMAAFLVVILIGSVQLAWHYAVDGYAGILIAWGAWALAGRMLPAGIAPAQPKRS